MILAKLRFVSLMSTAATMGAALAHLLELPAKMRYEPSLYVRLHRTLYPNYGRVAGNAEILSVVATSGLAWMLRRRRSAASGLTTAAAGCLAVAHGAFWMKVHPANRTMASWPLDAIPVQWKQWRDQWEYTHAARAVLTVGALAALAGALLTEGSEPADRGFARETGRETKV